MLLNKQPKRFVCETAAASMDLTDLCTFYGIHPQRTGLALLLFRKNMLYYPCIR